MMVGQLPKSSSGFFFTVHKACNDSRLFLVPHRDRFGKQVNRKHVNTKFKASGVAPYPLPAIHWHPWFTTSWSILLLFWRPHSLCPCLPIVKDQPKLASVSPWTWTSPVCAPCSNDTSCSTWKAVSLWSLSAPCFVPLLFDLWLNSCLLPSHSLPPFNYLPDCILCFKVY